VFNPYGDLADFATGDQMPGIPCAFDAAAFAATKLHESPGLRLRLGAIAWSGAVADFDWRNVVDCLEHFYEQLIARNTEYAGNVG
jgi:hypothetical protein